MHNERGRGFSSQQPDEWAGAGLDLPTELVADTAARARDRAPWDVSRQREVEDQVHRTSRGALLAAMGVAVGVSLLPATAIDEGVVLAAVADPQAVTPAAATATTPPPPPWLPQMSPEVDVQEITKADEGRKVAIFNNGQVYIGYSKVRRYLVTHVDGSRGEHMIDEGIHLVTTTTGVPVPRPLLGDIRFAGVHPTPEQMAEMDRIANGG